jgi:hypothetical protein
MGSLVHLWEKGPDEESSAVPGMGYILFVHKIYTTQEILEVVKNSGRAHSLGSKNFWCYREVAAIQWTEGGHF